MFGRRALKNEIRILRETIATLEFQVEMLENRLSTQAKIRSAASKKGWVTRREKR